MTKQPVPPRDDTEKREGQAPGASDTREGLDHLREGVGDKRPFTAQLQELLQGFSALPPEQRKQRLAAIMATATPLLLTYILGERKEAGKPAKRKRKRRRDLSPAASDEEVTEEGGETKEPDPRERRRKVVCNDVRLICINTDPVASMVPRRLHGNSSYLLEYGLPEFDVFVEEMIGILAPDAANKEEGLKRAWRILKASPMGKYQCMPQYLFGNVEAFKKYNIRDWKEEGQEEEKLRAVWEFLQSEDLQKEACRVYLTQNAGRYGGDSQLVAASFYGGGRAADALKAYKAGTATPEQIAYLTKPQGAYRSILSYAQTSKSGSFDIETELARTASRESGNLEGKKSKERDAAWEQDARFAYNQQSTGNRVA